MDRAISTFLHTFLFGILTIPATNVFAEMTVTGGSPSTYNVADPAARKKFNALCNSGATTLTTECQNRLVELVHPVKVLGGIPLTGAQATHIALAPVSGGSLSGSRTPFTPGNSQTNPTLTNFGTPVQSVGAISSEPPAVSEFLYSPLLSPLHIMIKDEGYGLNSTQKDHLIALLSALPASQLTYVHNIVIRPAKSNSPDAEIDGDTIVVNEPPVGTDSTIDGKLFLERVAEGIGANVYQNILTPAEQQEFAKLANTTPEPGNAGVYFQGRYGNYLAGTDAAFKSDLNIPEPPLPSAPGQVQAIIKQLNPPAPYSQLALNLFMASIFGYPNSQVTNSYKISDTGDVTRQYVPMWQNANWIVVGDYSFATKSGGITGTEYIDRSTNSGYSAGLPATIPIPQTVSNRLLKKSDSEVPPSLTLTLKPLP